MDEQYFSYGDTEIVYLAMRDVALGRAIDRLGPLQRKVYPDLFYALVNSIVGQQISTKAHASIWRRVCTVLGSVTPETVMTCDSDALCRCGLSSRKVSCIKEAARRVAANEFDLDALEYLSDDEVCRRLKTLPGVGVWTAEMLMIFSMCRPDIFSQSDRGIQRGLCILHHHSHITPELFANYKRRYSPYGSVASLYLWEIAKGIE